MTIHVVSILVLLVGLVMYVVSSNGKAAEIGRIMFFAGLLAVLLLGGVLKVPVLFN